MMFSSDGRQVGDWYEVLFVVPDWYANWLQG